MRSIKATQMRQWHNYRFRRLFDDQEIVTLNVELLAALGLDGAIVVWSDDHSRQRHEELEESDALPSEALDKILGNLSYNLLTPHVDHVLTSAIALLKRGTGYILVMYLIDDEYDEIYWSPISEKQFRVLREEFETSEK
jgi:hypothetical protein